MEKAMNEQEKKPEAPVSIFMCGPGNAKCKCRCPESCEHVWDGPTWTSPDGCAQSATCSRCGAVQMDHDLWVLP